MPRFDHPGASIPSDITVVHDVYPVETQSESFEESITRWAQNASSGDTDKAVYALRQGGTQVNLSGLQLDSLPDIALPSGVLMLDLSNNPELTTIPERFLSQSSGMIIRIDNTSISGETIQDIEGTGSEIFFSRQPYPVSEDTVSKGTATSNPSDTEDKLHLQSQLHTIIQESSLDTASVKVLNEHQVGFSEKKLCFPHLGGMALVLERTEGLYGFHFTPGNLNQILAFKKFIEESQCYKSGQSLNLYGTCRRGLRWAGDQNHMEAWKRDMTKIADILNFKGCISGYDLSKAPHGPSDRMVNQSVYVEYTRGNNNEGCHLKYKNMSKINVINASLTQKGETHGIKRVKPIGPWGERGYELSIPNMSISVGVELDTDKTKSALGKMHCPEKHEIDSFYLYDHQKHSNVSSENTNLSKGIFQSDTEQKTLPNTHSYATSTSGAVWRNVSSVSAVAKQLKTNAVREKSIIKKLNEMRKNSPENNYFHIDGSFYALLTEGKKSIYFKVSDDAYYGGNVVKVYEPLEKEKTTGVKLIWKDERWQEYNHKEDSSLVLIPRIPPHHAVLIGYHGTTLDGIKNLLTNGVNVSNTIRTGMNVNHRNPVFYITDRWESARSYASSENNILEVWSITPENLYHDEFTRSNKQGVSELKIRGNFDFLYFKPAQYGKKMPKSFNNFEFDTNRRSGLRNERSYEPGPVTPISVGADSVALAKSPEETPVAVAEARDWLINNLNTPGAWRDDYFELVPALLGQLPELRACGARLVITCHGSPVYMSEPDAITPLGPSSDRPVIVLDYTATKTGTDPNHYNVIVPGDSGRLSFSQNERGEIRLDPAYRILPIPDNGFCLTEAVAQGLNTMVPGSDTSGQALRQRLIAGLRDGNIHITGNMLRDVGLPGGEQEVSAPQMRTSPDRRAQETELTAGDLQPLTQTDINKRAYYQGRMRNRHDIPSCDELLEYLTLTARSLVMPGNDASADDLVAKDLLQAMQTHLENSGDLRHSVFCVYFALLTAHLENVSPVRISPLINYLLGKSNYGARLTRDIRYIYEQTLPAFAGLLLRLSELRNECYKKNIVEGLSKKHFGQKNKKSFYDVLISSKETSYEKYKSSVKNFFSFGKKHERWPADIILTAELLTQGGLFPDSEEHQMWALIADQPVSEDERKWMDLTRQLTLRDPVTWSQKVVSSDFYTVKPVPSSTYVAWHDYSRLQEKALIEQLHQWSARKIDADGEDRYQHIQKKFSECACDSLDVQEHLGLMMRTLTWPASGNGEVHQGLIRALISPDLWSVIHKFDPNKPEYDRRIRPVYYQLLRMVIPVLEDDMAESLQETLISETVISSWLDKAKTDIAFAWAQTLDALLSHRETQRQGEDTSLRQEVIRRLLLPSYHDNQARGFLASMSTRKYSVYSVLIRNPVWHGVLAFLRQKNLVPSGSDAQVSGNDQKKYRKIAWEQAESKIRQATPDYDPGNIARDFHWLLLQREREKRIHQELIQSIEAEVNRVVEEEVKKCWADITQSMGRELGAQSMFSSIFESHEVGAAYARASDEVSAMRHHKVPEDIIVGLQRAFREQYVTDIVNQIETEQYKQEEVVWKTGSVDLMAPDENPQTPASSQPVLRLRASEPAPDAPVAVSPGSGLYPESPLGIPGGDAASESEPGKLTEMQREQLERNENPIIKANWTAGQQAAQSRVFSPPPSASREDTEEQRRKRYKLQAAALTRITREVQPEIQQQGELKIRKSVIQRVPEQIRESDIVSRIKSQHIEKTGNTLTSQIQKSITLNTPKVQTQISEQVKRAVISPGQKNTTRSASRVPQQPLQGMTHELRSWLSQQRAGTEIVTVRLRLKATEGIKEKIKEDKTLIPEPKREEISKKAAEAAEKRKREELERQKDEGKKEKIITKSWSPPGASEVPPGSNVHHLPGDTSKENGILVYSATDKGNQNKTR